MVLTEQAALARLQQIQQLAPFIHQSMAFSGAAGADLGGAERISLVISRRHVADGLELHQPEWNAVVALLKQRKEELGKADKSISDWNVGLNSGEAAGQTVFHAHWHLIPRREGDCEQPKGGVRGVIPEHQAY